MNKFLTFCIVVAVILFASGCVSQNNATDEKGDRSDINQRSDDHDRIPDLIIKQSDIPGFRLDNYDYIAFSKSDPLVNVPSDVYNIGILRGYFNFTTYKDSQNYALPIGNRHIGETSSWRDNSGREIQVITLKFDSNSEFNNYFSTDFGKQTVRSYCINVNDPKIGDNSAYCSWSNPNVLNIILEYTYNKNFVFIRVTDEKDKSLSEAIRIANVVKSRLK